MLTESVLNYYNAPSLHICVMVKFDHESKWLTVEKIEEGRLAHLAVALLNSFHFIDVTAL